MKHTIQNPSLAVPILNNMREAVFCLSDTGKLICYNNAFVLLWKDNIKADIANDWKKQFMEQVDQPEKITKYIVSNDATTFDFSINHCSFFRIYKEQLTEENMCLYVVRDISRKRNYISNLVHEMRTPLSCIKGLSERLSENKLRQNKIEQYGVLIRSEADRLNTMLNDFLDLQRMLSGAEKLKRKNVNLNDWGKRFLTICKSSYPSHRFVFEAIGSEFKVRIDDEKWTRMALNLVSNAVKYSNSDCEIKFILEENFDSITFSVIDQGIGIPEKDIPHLFTQYYRVEDKEH
ncbi:MAG: sensor histidine kinase, partial [Exiguobacterium mexicanum]